MFYGDTENNLREFRSEFFQKLFVPSYGAYANLQHFAHQDILTCLARLTQRVGEGITPRSIQSARA